MSADQTSACFWVPATVDNVRAASGGSAMPTAVYFCVRSPQRVGGSISERLQELRAEFARLAQASDGELLQEAKLEAMHVVRLSGASLKFFEDGRAKLRAERLKSWKNLHSEASATTKAA